jgi:hypothetical protein
VWGGALLAMLWDLVKESHGEAVIDYMEGLVPMAPSESIEIQAHQ